MRTQNCANVQDDAITRQGLALFDQFLDGHREIANDIRKDPSLVNNEECEEPSCAPNPLNPRALMQRENRYEQRKNRAYDPDRIRRAGNWPTSISSLDNHREIAREIRKNPSVVNDAEYVRNHPALQTYLQEHPGVREEIKENPNAFMQKEARYGRNEDNRDNRGDLDTDRRDRDQRADNRGDRGTTRQEHDEGGMDRDATHKQFGELLGGHSSVAQEPSKDPSLVKNQEYIANHPELQDYLKAHPDVRDELMKNPQSRVKSAQHYTNNSNGAVKTPTTVSKTPTTDPKLKQ